MTNLPPRTRAADHEAGDDGLTPVIARNIRALCRRREREARGIGVQERAVEQITRFAGSMLSVYLHLAAYGFWIAANLGAIPGIKPWDDTFVVLAVLASVECIFLSTFVLIAQNRMAGIADKRADLDLQISLLTEHELTQIAIVVADIAKALNVKSAAERDIKHVMTDVEPEAVMDKIEAETEGQAEKKPEPEREPERA